MQDSNVIIIDLVTPDSTPKNRNSFTPIQCSPSLISESVENSFSTVETFTGNGFSWEKCMGNKLIHLFHGQIVKQFDCLDDEEQNVAIELLLNEESTAILLGKYRFDEEIRSIGCLSCLAQFKLTNKILEKTKNHTKYCQK